MTNTTHLTAWEYQARKIQEKKDKEEAANPKPHLREAEVVEDGHEIPIEELGSRTHAGIIARYALERGWLVKCGASRFRTADRMWKGAVKEGEIKTHAWVQGVLGTHYFTASPGLMLFDGWPVGGMSELKVGIDEYGTADLPAVN